MECKICNKKFKTNQLFSRHLSKHNMNFLIYLTKYENLEIPKCKYCGNNCKRRNGFTFTKTCTNKKCQDLSLTGIKTSNKTKAKLRKIRLDWMKNNPEKTAWRQSNQSYPEKVFENKLKELGFDKKYLIIKERSIFPYFIDFCFENEKIAIEIDGSQHNLKEQKESDNLKDELLKSNGFKIIRISAKDVLSNLDLVFKQIIDFIDNKNEDYLSIRGIYNDSDLKKSKHLEKMKLKNIEKQNLILSRKESLDKIDCSKIGWLKLITEEWKISHTQVKRWIKKYYPDFKFFIRNQN